MIIRICLCLSLAAGLATLALPAQAREAASNGQVIVHSAAAAGNASGADKDDDGRDTNAGNENGDGNRGSGKDVPPQPEAMPAPQLPQTNADAATALEQVDRREALPLAALLIAVGRISEGRVLEIEIVTFRNEPAYAVTLLERSGRLRRILLEARTGAPIGTLK